MCRLVHLANMDIKALIKDVEAFAEKTGKTPEYVCRKATGNPRLFERLQGRLEQSVSDEKRIRRFMAGASKAAPKSTAKQPSKKAIPQKVKP